MKNPGTIYLSIEVRLVLTKLQTTVGIRIYKLFKDYIHSLTKLSGITLEDLYCMTRQSFDHILQDLNRDFLEDESLVELEEIVD